MSGECVAYGEKKNAYKGSDGKAEGEGTRGRLRSRREYNITTDIKEVGRSVNSIRLAKKRGRYGSLE
jgi:hypothetical protein